jgi:hypothetical protein
MLARNFVWARRAVAIVLPIAVRVNVKEFASGALPPIVGYPRNTAKIALFATHPCRTLRQINESHGLSAVNRIVGDRGRDTGCPLPPGCRR